MFAECDKRDRSGVHYGNLLPFQCKAAQPTAADQLDRESGRGSRHSASLGQIRLTKQ